MFKYLIIYRNDSGISINEPNRMTAVIMGECNTLEEAKALRGASGDIVIDRETHEVVMSDEWLWDWEKADPNSYAMQIITNKYYDAGKRRNYIFVKPMDVVGAPR